ncbi:hypothetical protein CURE108131_25235 [Cupriavidus respiraculi]|uniref:Uncharacterized protein n=1 Tax=Cupriavidus respiraculi TaxID=195930 RepID=A0ABM8XVD3_9BURK|nr:hypothetical protein [Cupriavidus respiraculi]CAG9184362.1 hypothetical protein LMG21510_05078 [Cupriavidus respiraculi]
MPSPRNEHQWAKQASTDDAHQDATARAFPPPLTREQLRAMYRRNSTPEVRDLLWEIARLQALARRAAQLTACFPLYDSHATSPAFPTLLEAIRRQLDTEPCVVEMASRAREFEEVFSAVPHATRRRGR